MSFFRRAGAAIARIFQSAADPAAEPDKVLLYGKDVAGVSQLFARSDDGTVHQITPGGGGGSPTTGGEAGLLGTGTALDPFIPVAGPYRPIDSFFVFDDYMTQYNEQAGGLVRAYGNTSMFSYGGAAASFNINSVAQGKGPNAAAVMMGVLELKLIGAGAGNGISATQWRDQLDSGQCISLQQLSPNYDLWQVTRVAFEGVGDFEGTQEVNIGFRSQIEMGFGAQEGIWFHPRFNGVQTNWFALYRISDDNGLQFADIDTGVRVGFTAAHPATPRAPQVLMSRLFKHPLSGGFDATVQMMIDGVIVQTVELLNPDTQFAPMAGIISTAAAQSQTVYIDYMMTVIKGRAP